MTTGNAFGTSAYPGTFEGHIGDSAASLTSNWWNPLFSLARQNFQRKLKVQCGYMASRPVADKFLERALMFTIICHGVAMLSMAVFLLPGMPGHGTPEEHLIYIKSHPWQWRLGWFPWQVTAFSDILLAVALYRTSWIPRGWATLGLILTWSAYVIEQPAEFRWMWDVPSQYFIDFEDRMFRQTSLWAAMFYALAAVAWSFAFAGGRVWNRFLTWLSVATWGLLLVCSVGPLLFPAFGPSAISAGVSVGFVLMMVWFAVAAELVMRRSRPFESYGRQAPWRSPYGWLIGPPVDMIGNSRLVRSFCELFPTLPLTSDVTSVLFANYLVPVEKLLPLVPEPLELQRLGPYSECAMLTIVAYKHGHLGPSILGPLRRLLPSPIQSNWRIYVRDPRTGLTGVWFASSTISNMIHALIARHFAEGLPMHVPAHSMIADKGDESYSIELAPRHDSAPDLLAEIHLNEAFTLPESWTSCFATYRSMLEYVVPQDRALSVQPWHQRVTSQEITLDIPLDQCRPLACQVTSMAVGTIAGETDAVCFWIPEMTFRFEKEIALNLD